MRTWYQCINKFIKYGDEHYYVVERHMYSTGLIKLNGHYVYMLNEEFDGLLRNDLIELLPE